MNLKRRLMIPVAVLALLGACSATGLPGKKDFERLGDKSIAERTGHAERLMQNAVNFFSEAPVSRLQTSDSNAFRLESDPGEMVPDVPIGRINAAPLKFGPLLNQVAEQAGMSWRISGNDKDTLMDKDIYLVQRNDAPLKTVLDELSDLTDAFYRVEGDRIIFSQDRLFVARVPRMADSQKILEDGLTSMGATDIFRDKLSGTITFRATRPVYKSVKRLMKSLEEGRDMIVYDFWLIDRNLTDQAGLGGNLNLKNIGAKVSNIDKGTLAAGGTQLLDALFAGSQNQGFVSGNLGGMTVEATVQFLRSLGETETVARPTISMLSGDKSSFSSGNKSEYIRSVNSTATTNTTSSGTDTRTLETGIDITVEGAHNAGVISTDFEIDISELLGYDKFDTGNVTLRLPKTAQRKVNAHLEARPGDVMVLGGIIRNTQDKNRQEIVGAGIPTQTSNDNGKTETIILVRPRLVQIRPVKGAKNQKSMDIEPGVGEIKPRKNPISDVINDENHAKSLLKHLKN